MKGRAARRLLGATSGAAAMEFALVILVALPLLVGLVEVGRALHTRNALEYAADVAARSTLVQLRYERLSLPELEVRLLGGARTRWTGGTPDRLSVAVATHDDRLRLELRYRFDFLIPLVPLDTITLRAVRTVPAMAE